MHVFVDATTFSVAMRLLGYCTRLGPEVRRRRVRQETLRPRWRGVKAGEILVEGRHSKRNPFTRWLDGEGGATPLNPLATDTCSSASAYTHITISDDSLH